MRCLVQRFSRLTFARLMAAAGTLATVVGCSSSSSVSTEPSPVKCAVTLSTASLSAGGGTGTITVTTGQECGWTASTQFGWIAGLSPTSGQGNGQVAFSVGPNPSQIERQGEVVVNDSRAQIRQEAATCQFTIAFQQPGLRERGRYRHGDDRRHSGMSLDRAEQCRVDHGHVAFQR